MLSNQQLLSCPICHKEYQSPIILPCGESICSKCVSPIGPFSNNFLCRLCNSVHEIPENGFPQNKALVKAININKATLSERQIEKRLKCIFEIEADWVFLRKSFETCKEKIKDSVKEIINDIEIEADLKCDQINQLRNDLVEKVLNYETNCLENYTNYNTEYYYFVKELEPYKKDTHVKENVLIAETIKSRLGIEIQKFKNQISNYETFSFKKNPASIDPRALGFIYEHHIDPIKLSEYMKIDFSKQLDGLNELRQNLKIKKLNEKFFSISFVMTSYDIDIATDSNSLVYKLVLQVHDLNQCQRRFELELSENQTDYEIEANEGMIALNVGNILIGFDYNLNEVARINVVFLIQSIVISNNLILCLGKSEFGSTLQAYDFSLNLFKIYSSENKTCLYLPENTEKFFVNDSFLFFKEKNQIIVVDKDDGRFVKSIKIDQDTNLFGINNQNVIAVFNKALKIISFLDFDGNRRDERNLDEYPSEKTEYILNNNYSIDLIDFQNLAVYI